MKLELRKVTLASFGVWIRMVIYEATKDLIDFGVVASFRCLVLYRRADIKLGVSFAFPYE